MSIGADLIRGHTEAIILSLLREKNSYGYITSYWGEQGAGARRKYYAITARGVDACRRMAEEWEEAREIIDQLLKRGEKDHA